MSDIDTTQMRLTVAGSRPFAALGLCELCGADISLPNADVCRSCADEVGVLTVDDLPPFVCEPLRMRRFPDVLDEVQPVTRVPPGPSNPG